MRNDMKMVVALFGLLLTALPAAAQDWPTKPVKIVVPFGPGSTPDVVARLIADHLQKKLGQPFTVDNKPGASGNIGTDAVAKAKPDGDTIGISIGGPIAITQLVSLPSALTVNSAVKVNVVADLVAALKREPGRFNYGSIGNGSRSH